MGYDPVVDAAPYPRLSFALDVVTKLGALAIGGYWTYWNHWKRRTYAERLELEIATQAIGEPERLWIVTVRAKNVGNSVVRLGDTRACRVVSFSSKDDDELAEDLVDSFDVFAEEETIESGESIQDQFLIPADSMLTDAILRLELIIDAGQSGNFRWRTKQFLFREVKSDAESAHE